jgi:hypothetical protein
VCSFVGAGYAQGRSGWEGGLLGQEGGEGVRAGEELVVTCSDGGAVRRLFGGRYGVVLKGYICNTGEFVEWVQRCTGLP